MQLRSSAITVLFVAAAVVATQAADPVMQAVSPAGVSTGDTWTALTGTQAFVFDATDADGDLDSLKLDIYGPSPYDTSATAFQLTLLADEANPASADDLALLTEIGSSAAYDAASEQWTLTLDTVATWGSSVDDPNSPYYDPNIAEGDAVWPAGEYAFQLELADQAGGSWGDNSTPYWPAEFPANPPKASTCLYYFHTIQSAIDGLQTDAGDTINVTAGTFAEQLTLTTSLTIAGAGAGTSIVQAPTTMVADGNGMKNIVTITGAGVSAEISGLTIAGPGPGASGSINSGIFIGGTAYADIHDNTIADIRDEPLGGGGNGQGIWVGRSSVSETATAAITNNVITGYQKGGIVVDNTGSDADIVGNTVTGVGPTPTVAQNGIQVSRGATAAINDNTVSSNEYNGAGDWWSGGILAFNTTGVTITGNTVSANNAGIWLTEFSGTTTGCTISGNDCTNNINTGIILQEAGVSGNTVQYNTVTGGWTGIWLSNSSNTNTCADNTLLNQTGNGFYLWQSDNNTIERNTIRGHISGGGDAWGIAFDGDGTDSSDGNIARDNTITHGDIGVWVGNAADNNTVQDNYITRNLVGVQISTYSGEPDPTNTALLGNGLSGNSVAGLENTTTQTISAENNWWGDAGGPYDPDDGGEITEVDAASCTGTPADESNADGVGESILDTNASPVDYCPWSLGYPRIALEPDADCYATGETVTIDVWMRDISESIVGGQFFLQYDTSKLQFVGMNSTDAPFDQVLFNDVDPNSGTIDYAVNATLGHTGVSGDARMAIITFTAQTQICSETDLLLWRAHDPASRLTEYGGAEVLPLLVDLVVNDDEPPVITGFPDDASLECFADVPAADTGLVSATDNCGAVTVTHENDSDNGGAGCTSDPRIITRTYRVTDECGNFVEQQQTFTIADTTPPVVTCPPEGNISVASDADLVCGGAVVTFGAASANDNCDGALAATCDPPSGSLFPLGTTVVTCSATDSCGNTGDCTFEVEVRPVNEVAVTLELQDVSPDPFTRCITVELWECGQPAVISEQEFTFTAGIATGLVEVPCAVYDCITARDDLHTLRITDEDDFGVTPVIDSQYVADFTDKSGAGGDDDSLIGGNFNSDTWVDILDFGVLTAQWNNNFGTADTDCATTAPHSDASGDGIVSAEDFTYIQVNFLLGSDANCCGEPGMRDGDRPVTRISVDDLYDLGLGDLAVGDLNDDGWLDQEDVVAFIQGARPGVTTVPVQPSRIEGAGVQGAAQSRPRP